MSPPATPPPPSAHHPDLDLLSAFHEGRLDAEEWASCARHVASCRDCARVLAELEDFAAAEHLTPNAATAEAAALMTRAVLQQARAAPPPRFVLPASAGAWFAAAGLALLSAGLGAWWGLYRGGGPSGAVESVALAPLLVTRDGSRAPTITPRAGTRWLHLSAQLPATESARGTFAASLGCGPPSAPRRLTIHPDAVGRFELVVPAEALGERCALEVTVWMPDGRSLSWTVDAEFPRADTP